jgi:hypothetical protein
MTLLMIAAAISASLVLMAVVLSASQTPESA